MAGPPLTDVVVLEIATGVAGAYTGRMFADLGAQVVKVEPPPGDPLRASWPLRGGESAFFNYLNAGKLGLALESTDPRVDGLAAHADIVLHNLAGPAGTDLEARTQAAGPRTVIVSFTPYGRTGERANWQTTEFTEYATSGYGYIAGDPALEPLSLPGYQVQYHAGMHATVAALAGLRHARATGEGQCIEISHQEAILSDHSWFISSWTHQGLSQQRTGSLYVRCADGFVYLFNLVAYPNLFALIERFDLLEDDSLVIPLNWQARFPEILAAFGAWAATRTKEEVYHACQDLRIAASPLNTMADVVSNPQLLAREWFGRVEVGGESFVAPGFPYRLTGTPCTAPGRAPRLAEHQEVVFAPGFRWANADSIAPAEPGAGRRQALAGVRVLELTANWAGPVCGRHLGDLGADVVKIELATKPATRGIAYMGNDLWPFHFNRAGYFNKLNRNKRAICLNLSTPAGKRVFLQLVREADVVLENNSARVMGNLGLGYADLRAVNPRIIMCSMSGYGGTGPERDYAAYGSNIETVSGLASILGYGPGEYFGTGTFYADPVAGTHGAAAILAALHAREKTGEGQWIDMSLLESVTPFFAQPLLQYTVAGEVPVPVGNRSRDFSPQGAYATAGRDCWLALSVRDERDWHGLCATIGRPDFAGDPWLNSVEGRRARHDQIDAAIREWARVLDHNDAARRLQAAGVPAAPIMQNWEAFTDNHLNSRDFFVRISHPEAGTTWWPGFPWRLSRTPGLVTRHAPLFGQHNREVFSEVAGLDESAIAELYLAGITSDAPLYATA